MIRKYALFTVFEFLRNSQSKVSIRELARKAKVGVATAKRCIDYLVEKKLVTKEVIGNIFQCKLNESNQLVRQMKISLSIAEIEESKLIEELLESYPSINSILLFGSVALGTDNPSSDVDLLIISHQKIKIGPLKAERKLKRELSIITYPHSVWRGKAKSDKIFYEKVIIDSISLYGEKPVVR